MPASAFARERSSSEVITVTSTPTVVSWPVEPSGAGVAGAEGACLSVIFEAEDSDAEDPDRGARAGASAGSGKRKSSTVSGGASAGSGKRKKVN